MPLSCAPQKITERVLVHKKKANPVHVHTPSTLMRAGCATQRENLTALRSEGSSGPETDPAVTLSVRRRRSSLARVACVLVNITDDSDRRSGSSCVRSDAAVVRDLIYIDS